MCVLATVLEPVVRREYGTDAAMEPRVPLIRDSLGWDLI